MAPLKVRKGIIRKKGGRCGQSAELGGRTDTMGGGVVGGGQ